MADVQVYTFRELQTACANRGLNARLHIFDNGDTVIVSDLQGNEILRATAEHGDRFTSTDMAAKTLMERGAISIFDFPSSLRKVK